MAEHEGREALWRLMAKAELATYVDGVDHVDVDDVAAYVAELEALRSNATGMLNSCETQLAEQTRRVAELEALVAEAREVSSALRSAVELQADYASLPCRELDGKYGEVIDLTKLAERVSDARWKHDGWLARTAPKEPK